jgi:hypothetical protein
VNRIERGDWSRFVAVLTREKPQWTVGKVAAAAEALRRCARAQDRDNVARCNDERWTEEASDRVDARTRQVLAELGFEGVLQRDPRGAALRLVLPSGMTNDCGQTGYCVPTA